MRLLHRRSPVAKLVRSLPRGAVAVDCGANVGDVTVALARRCSLVVAFEPNPVAFRVLEERVCERANVRLVNAAVGATDGNARLYDHRDAGVDPVAASVGSSLHASKGNVDTSRWTTVEVVDLDRFLGDLHVRVDVVKLDVEGSEIEVLEKLMESGRIETFGVVVVEMHDRVIPDLRERGTRLRERLADPRYSHVRLDWE